MSGIWRTLSTMKLGREPNSPKNFHPISCTTWHSMPVNEIRRIYVAGDDHDNLMKAKTEVSHEEPQAKTFERLSVDQPEVIEGIDDIGSKDVPDEERTANAAKTGEGHIGRYDSVDATRTNLQIKEK
ncbi:receptor_IA-2 domain-containing protein [Caerostris extrusa]|uniref:Receptor_IA-2 domain-containing protein n=1 Tax=Caerostris extrusa TaxID=172846 RepID=A0AAV4VL27_CAEEX|nr:receptor_IA-2 domain-containing protein [Caerostris extrusa]